MSLNLGISNLAEVNPFDDIFVGLHPTMEVNEIVIASGQNLKRGAGLGLISTEANPAKGKYKIWDTDSTDGSEELAGILGCDVDATSQDEKGFMYVHGEFLKDGLSAGHTIVSGVYNNGAIVIKEVKS
jgi:hypothetical protein